MQREGIVPARDMLGELMEKADLSSQELKDEVDVLLYNVLLLLVVE